MTQPNTPMQHTPKLRIIAILTLLVAVVGIALVVKNRLNQRNQATAASAAPAPVLKLAPSDVWQVQEHGFTQVIPITGTIKARESTIVRAKVAAEIKQLHVREGDEVRQGQVLAELDSTEFDLRMLQAQRVADANKAQLEIAQRNLSTNQALAQQGFISATALQNAQSNEAAARANFDAAIAGLDLARKAKNDTLIKAPIHGRVAQRWMQAGERVSIDARIVEIVNLDQLEIEAAVSPEQAAQIEIGHTAKLGTESAKVVRINPAAQSGSRAVLIYLSLPSSKLRTTQPNWVQGQFIKGQIVLNTTQSLVIPPSALQVSDAAPQVRVWHQDSIQTRHVQIGQRGWLMPASSPQNHPTPTEVVQVLSGLQAGDWVLREGNASLKEGTPARLASAPTPSL